MRTILYVLGIVLLCPAVASAWTIPAGESRTKQGITITNNTNHDIEADPDLDGPPSPPNSKWILNIEVPEDAVGHVEVKDENSTEGDGDTAINFSDPRNPPDSSVFGGGLGTGNGLTADRVNGITVGTP